jgi:hypothetical protein
LDDNLPPIEDILQNWLTTKQAADLARMSANRVATLCAQGKLRARKIGRVWYVDPAAAALWYKGQHRQPGGVRPPG